MFYTYERLMQMNYKKKKHAVYLCTYHMVFVTKYRKPVISDDIGDSMKNYAAYLVQGSGGELISIETEKDHMHLLVSLPPDLSPTRMVRTLKGSLSKYVKEKYRQELLKYYWDAKTPFWSPSYFVATTGSVSLEKVREYVNSQRSEEHQAKKANRHSR